MRRATVTRKTAETDISLALCLDGIGHADVNTGIGFLDHMLTLFAKHGRFDLSVACTGDIRVDGHHTTEDIAIALGTALKQALGDKRGICRYSSLFLPMDEALVLCAVDISGRGCLRFEMPLPAQRVGDLDTELVQEFFSALARTADITIHLHEMDGSNTHHIIEAAFKGLGRALRHAVSIDPDAAEDIPSTKGVL